METMDYGLSNFYAHTHTVGTEVVQADLEETLSAEQGAQCCSHWMAQRQ